MNKMPKASILATAIALIGMVWIFAVVAYTMIFILPWLCLGSIVCTLIAIAVSELYLLVLRKPSGEQAAEPGALGALLTISYFVITVLLNTVLVVLGWGTFNGLLLTLNMAALVCYIIGLLWVEQHTARLTAQLARTERKSAVCRNISGKLGELLAVTEDAQIRDRLLKLKEAVDYSTNITTGATLEKEQRMLTQLEEIMHLTILRADRAEILEKVDAAAMTWKMRSSRASNAR